MNLIFIRHGQSEWNKENKFTVALQTKLNEVQEIKDVNNEKLKEFFKQDTQAKFNDFNS